VGLAHSGARTRLWSKPTCWRADLELLSAGLSEPLGDGREYPTRSPVELRSHFIRAFTTMGFHYQSVFTPLSYRVYN
jgi:hypothetical protein